MNEKPPPSYIFHFTNWIQLILDMRDVGYSQADIRFVLNTAGVMDDLRRAVEADNARKVRHSK